MKISIPFCAHQPLVPGQGQGAELVLLQRKNMTDLFFTTE